MKPIPKTTTQVLKIAREHAPTILFDRNEPFLPHHVGVSLITEPSSSPSSGHSITFNEGVETVIEYAIWWDWDIQHLYELEHIWVHLNGDQEVARVEASSHGRFADHFGDERDLPIRNGRVHLYSEPGKHAFFSSLSHIETHGERLIGCCRDRAGSMDILVQPAYRDQLASLRPYDHYLARTYMRSEAFTPSLIFDNAFDLSSVPFITWQELNERIPEFVLRQTDKLRDEKQGIKAVLLDSGDTLIDEASEIYRGGVVQDAHPIPGAQELLEALTEEGYLVALVADGKVESFDNVHGKLGFTRHFITRSISEAVGVEKPDRRIFNDAFSKLGLKASDAANVVYVGNNLRRDMAGANALGLKTVWINWSPRRRKTPNHPLEEPNATITEPMQLLEKLHNL
ncbi:HAD family hydrolase [Roseibium sp. SCP14]|uniref:HAD family hydrolase n=1 Tax=Roseibium sp. SCP14 TaxID=3141375 RepID=UPI003338CAAD